jgi:hypothetical protein
MLENLEPKKPAPCKMGLMINALNDVDRDVINIALNDYARWTSHALASAINERGLKVTRETLHTHRVKACRCYA